MRQDQLRRRIGKFNKVRIAVVIIVATFILHYVATGRLISMVSISFLANRVHVEGVRGNALSTYHAGFVGISSPSFSPFTFMNTSSSHKRKSKSLLSTSGVVKSLKQLMTISFIGYLAIMLSLVVAA